MCCRLLPNEAVLWLALYWVLQLFMLSAVQLLVTRSSRQDASILWHHRKAYLLIVLLPWTDTDTSPIAHVFRNADVLRSNH